MCQRSPRPGIRGKRRGDDLEFEPDEDEEGGSDPGDEERMKTRGVGAHMTGTSSGVAVDNQSEVARYTREVEVD